MSWGGLSFCLGCMSSIVRLCLERKRRRNRRTKVWNQSNKYWNKICLDLTQILNNTNSKFKMQTVKVEAFHGTAFKNVDEILKNGFKSNYRPDHWLGQGIYFYSDYDLAFWWTKTKFKSKNGTGCAIIHSALECYENTWLDLDTVNGVEYFQREVEEILSVTSHLTSLKFKTSKGQDDETRIKNFCFALDLLKKFRDIQLIAMTFKKNSPSYADRNIYRFEQLFFTLPLDFVYQERQICSTSNVPIVSKIKVFPS